MDSTFYQTFKEKVIPILQKIFQKTAEETLYNSFYEGSITVVLKPKTLKEKTTV